MQFTLNYLYLILFINSIINLLHKLNKLMILINDIFLSYNECIIN